jgi:hypothetical protein
MTFNYFVAEALAPQLGIQLLTRETYPLRLRGPDGTVRVSNLRLFSERLDHDMRPLVRELQRRRTWRERRVGGARLALLKARDVYDAGVTLGGMFLRERPVDSGQHGHP